MKAGRMKVHKGFAFGCLIVSGLLLYGTNFTVVLGVAVILFLTLGGWKVLVRAIKICQVIPRDLRHKKMGTEFIMELERCRAENSTILDLFNRTLVKHRNKPAILYEDQIWTFQDLEEYSNSVANYFHSEGFTFGDTVAILLENSPEYVGLWLGMAKIGIHTALINTNLSGDGLLHCISVSGAKCLVYGGEFSEVVANISSSLQGDGVGEFKMMCVHGYSSVVQNAVKLDEKLGAASKQPPPDGLYDKSFFGVLFYIYTSGTTGLPKPAIIKHSRYLFSTLAISKAFGIHESDIIYNTLPLYHSSGNTLGVGAMITLGSTLALRKKFSASNFWNDCIKYKCTVIIYIGEICRFLLSQPTKPSDTQHCVRLAFGNGLRAHIWEAFKERYQIPQIGEFYGATEGNTGVTNTTGKVGAVGFISFLTPSSVHLIHIDPDTNEPIRNSSGFCEIVDYNEPGEIVGEIIPKSATRQFDGYKGLESQTRKKILTDVFTKGDMYFHSGDIMKMDEQGYLYFTDRSGDTFRWRGENVSTTEVENTVAKILNDSQVACYGVEITGSEGRAGMIAVVKQDDIDFVELAKEVQKRLPSYAVPLFVRLVDKLDYTSTSKIMKRQLKEESFNINCINDPVFFLEPVNKVYVPLTEDIYKKICDEEYKF
ncbi:long-chain fatty acid transport protein 4-like [Dysidea avara]|uniref:long-chain fatty acid transport protein 4-like n=1 Tax=Dysidea avara TaxID=196820 RepID=UPI0033199BCE